jgi:hypothetical protein
MKLVDLSALNRLVEELNAQATLALAAKEPLDYIAEVGKLYGLVSLLSHETNLLSTEIIKCYNSGSAEAMNLGQPTKSSPSLKHLIDILPEGIKDFKKN